MMLSFLLRQGFITLAALLVLAGPALGNEYRAVTLIAPDTGSEYVSQVVVHKSQRRLHLMDGDDILRSYPISLGENPVGHKLFEGDSRTPEGEYTLDWRNYNSDFYKSIHISYPSEEDRALADAWGLDPGGSIMIHGLPNEAGDYAFAYAGLDWTNGCIAVNNEAKDEIWQLVRDGTPIRILP